VLGNDVVIFGGWTTGPDSGDLGDTWRWNGSAWTQLPIQGPGARYDHVMASIGDKVILFGGIGSTTPGSGPLGDTWEFDGQSWTQRTLSTSPSARWGPGIVSR
jgi:hypothetical protein